MPSSTGVPESPEARDGAPTQHDTDPDGKDSLTAAILAPAKHPGHPLRSPRILWSLLKDTYQEWSDDNALRLGAALAYYTVFSLAPLLIVIIAVGGLVFGREAAHERIIEQVSALIGSEGATAVSEMIAQASKPAQGLVASIISLTAILLGATGVFAELQSGLNQIWDVPPKQTSWFDLLHKRVVSFSLVLGMGFLLLVSLVIGALLSALDMWFSAHMPTFQAILELAHVVVSFTVVTLVFAMIFKMLPDVRIAWGDVAVGATVTSLLFTVGQFAIGLYLGRGTVGSVYGAAGSLAVILVWVYYSSQILFFGAEFAQVYARRHGSHSSAPRV